MIIAVDFDGVLYDHDGKWRGGALSRGPIPGAREGMAALKAAGHTLIVFSTRGWAKRHRERMAAWLGEQGIPFDEIARTKPNADLYVDDKGLRFETWSQVLRAVEAPPPDPRLEVAIFGLRQDDNAARLLRTADAFGVQVVHFVACRPRVGRLAGNVPRRQWEGVEDYLASCLHPLVALHPRKSATPLGPLPPRCTLAFGGESDGLPPAVVQVADFTVRIPAGGTYSCLTVEAAAAIATFTWSVQWNPGA